MFSRVEDILTNNPTIPQSRVEDLLVQLMEGLPTDEHIHDLVGSPLKADAVSEMTDDTKIYIYTGSETGYTAGHWYYYNGSSWADGGVYNSAGINTDKTLSVEDKAADGKAVGDEISDLKSDLNDSVDRLESEINGGEVEKSDTLNISFTTGAGIIADSSDSLYGKTSSDSVLQYSDFVNIEKYESIDITMMRYHNAMNVGIVFYSDNVINNIPSNCIAGYACHSGAETMTTETRHFTIPSGAKYFRTSFRTGYQFTTCTGNYVEHTGGLPKINDDIGQLQDDVDDLSYLETKEKKLSCQCRQRNKRCQ